MEKFDGRLILASGSPRRLALMREAGYEFEVVCPPLNEPVLPGGLAEHELSAPGWAESLAYFKASAVARCYPDALVIGADTIVVHDNVLLGKPTDETDARRILSNLFAGASEVITGFAVLCINRDIRVISHNLTRLVMRAMVDDELETYLAGGAWRDKAGAYALQEGGDKFVESIAGSESNIVGLPMEKLAEVLDSVYKKMV